MDMRLQTTKYSIAGKEYKLRCNMNVLAEVQEMNGGEIIRALNNSRSFRTALQVGAAMLNDYAEENGWPERFTEKSLGRLIPTRETAAFSRMIVDMLYHALRAEDDPAKMRWKRTTKKTQKPAKANKLWLVFKYLDQCLA